jgi:hypothetical protein
MTLAVLPVAFASGLGLALALNAALSWLGLFPSDASWPAIAVLFAGFLGGSGAVMILFARWFSRRHHCPSCRAAPKESEEGGIELGASSCHACGHPLTLAAFDEDAAARKQETHGYHFDAKRRDQRAKPPAEPAPQSPELREVSNEELIAFRAGMKQAQRVYKPIMLAFLISFLACFPLFFLGLVPFWSFLAVFGAYMAISIPVGIRFASRLKCPHCAGQVSSDRWFPFSLPETCKHCNRSLMPQFHDHAPQA